MTAPLKQRLADIPPAQLHLFLMLMLTFTTGINDAVGYLGLDKVFTGNMTGNVAILGMALSGGTGLPILGPALALIGFLAGAALAGRVLKVQAEAWSILTATLFGAVAVTMLVLGVALLLGGEEPARGLQIAVTTVAAGAMGLQAATARIVSVKDVTTVVVTSTLTGLAADSILGSGKGGGTRRRVAAVAALLVGALLGALLLKWSLGAGLVLAGLVIASAAALGAWHERLVRTTPLV